jgi:myo-inositol-1(or 4)-monophosphatase
MHPFLNTAVHAARKAGDYIIRQVNRLHEIRVDHKGENDFVSEVDRRAEAAIIEIVQRTYPDHGILAEESGSLAPVDGCPYRWIIDPLDGTTNFLHGYPQFCVSIAVENRGEVEHAVVYDPITQELFTASRGGGAMMNNRRIRVSNRQDLASSLLATGFPARHPALTEDYLATFRPFHLGTAGIRRAGSAALDLAHVAAGRLDGYWEFRLGRWDIAAGSLLVREAGGMVGEPDGADGFLETGSIVAGSPKVYEAMVAILGRAPVLPHTKICMGRQGRKVRGTAAVPVTKDEE